MMNTHTTSNVDAYVAEFEQIKHRVGDDQVAAVILEQIAKDARTERIAATRSRNGAGNGWNHPKRNDDNNANGNGAPATEKQREYLQDLGVNVPKRLTKDEASALIDEATTE